MLSMDFWLQLLGKVELLKLYGELVNYHLQTTMESFKRESEWVDEENPKCSFFINRDVYTFFPPRLWKKMVEAVTRLKQCKKMF